MKFIRPVSLLVILVVTVLLAGCGVANQATANRTPSPSSATSTQDTKVISMPTNTRSSTPSASPTPCSFSQPRALAHRFIFSNLAESEQRIYAYDYEQREEIFLFELTTEMSRHNVGETPVPGQNLEETITLPQREGLDLGELYLSPDANILVALQAPHGRAPSFIHQIDLTTQNVVSLLLAEDLQWRIPIVSDRQPDILANIRPGYEEYAVAMAHLGYPAIKWSLDSQGFVFTIQTLLMGPPAQIYYITRDLPEMLPLAADLPGSDIGISASWSPDNRRIAFPRNANREGIWIIDVKKSDIVVELSSAEGLDLVSTPIWSHDGLFLAFEAGLPSKTFGNLYILEVETDQLIQLTNSEEEYGSPGDQVTQKSIFWLPDQSGLVYYEVGKRSTSQEGNFKIKFVNLESHEVVIISDLSPAFSRGDSISPIIVSPFDNVAIFLFGDPCIDIDGWIPDITFHFNVITIPEGEVIFEPPPDACLALPTWSPDGHLIAGHSGDDIVIWDLDSGEATIVASDLLGVKRLLGWVPATEASD